MPAKISLIAVSSLFLAMTACSASGECVKRDRETVTMAGTVRVVGNEPFTRLVLTVQDPKNGNHQTDLVIKGPLAGDIRERYQGKVIIVEGRRCAEEASGHLSCIEPERVIEVE